MYHVAMLTRKDDSRRSLSETGTRFGFRYGSKGTHTSRTIMLAELDQVLGTVPADADRAAYTTAIVDENVTDKKTVATRHHLPPRRQSRRRCGRSQCRSRHRQA